MLKKFILLGVVIFAILVPARNARIKDGRVAFNKMFKEHLIATAIYVVLITLVWWRMG